MGKQITNLQFFPQVFCLINVKIPLFFFLKFQGLVWVEVSFLITGPDETQFITICFRRWFCRGYR